MHNLMTESVPSFKNIFLATDFSVASQAAFETAVCLCKTLRANLFILHVFEYANVVSREIGGQFLEFDRTYEKTQSSLMTSSKWPDGPG